MSISAITNHNFSHSTENSFYWHQILQNRCVSSCCHIYLVYLCNVSVRINCFEWKHLAHVVSLYMIAKLLSAFVFDHVPKKVFILQTVYVVTFFPVYLCLNNCLQLEKLFVFANIVNIHTDWSRCKVENHSRQWKY